jgi:prophage regulatory protein
MQDSPPGLDRIIRMPELERVTGLSRSTIERLLKKGQFPQPLQLSENAKGFFESQVRAWQESLVPVGPEPGPETKAEGPWPWTKERSSHRSDRALARANAKPPRLGSGLARRPAPSSAPRRR